MNNIEANDIILVIRLISLEVKVIYVIFTLSKIK